MRLRLLSGGSVKYSLRAKNVLRRHRMDSENELMPFQSMDVAERPTHDRHRVKKRVAMLLGYVGSNYHGFQKSNNHENEILYPCKIVS